MTFGYCFSFSFVFFKTSTFVLFNERDRLRSIETGNELEKLGCIKMANVGNTAPASTLEKCKALLQEVVTELNSSGSNSEGIAPRPGSESIHNEHRRLFGFQYRGGGRGRYNPFSRGGPRPLKASKSN